MELLVNYCTSHFLSKTQKWLAVLIRRERHDIAEEQWMHEDFCLWEHLKYLQLREFSIHKERNSDFFLLIELLNRSLTALFLPLEVRRDEKEMKVINCNCKNREMVSSYSLQSVRYIHVDLLVNTPASFFFVEQEIFILREQESWAELSRKRWGVFFFVKQRPTVVFT